MPSIRKKGAGYEITISDGYDSNGKKNTISRTFAPDPKWDEKRAETEAMKFALRLEDRVKNGENINADKLTVEKLAKLYLSDMQPPALEKTTYFSYKSRIETRIIPYLGKERVSRINGHTISLYRKALRQDQRLDGRQKALKESTIDAYVAVLSGMLSYAVSEGWLKLNPLIYSGRRRRGRAKKEYTVQYFTLEQTKWFLWALDNPIKIQHDVTTRKRYDGTTYTVCAHETTWQLPLKWRFFFYLSLFTGNRSGENVSLRWQHIDFEKCTVEIKDSTANVNGETYVKDTKTHASRTVIVPPFIMAVGRQLLTEQKRAALMIGDKWQGYRGRQFDKNFIFQKWDGGQMHPQSPRAQFKRIIGVYNRNIAKSEEEMIPQDATLHGLRHTAASILIANNMDPRSVAGVLGHSTPTTTLNIYSYFFQQKNAEAANIMERVLVDPTINNMIVGK